MNKEKYIFLLGILLATSTLILPNLGLNLFGINFEDVPFILTLSLLVLFQFSNKEIKKGPLDSLWVSLLMTFLIFSLISSSENFLHPINLRFVLYILFGYLVYKFSLSFSNKDKLLKFIFLPLGIIPLTNFIVFLLKYSSPNNNGWIDSYKETNNLLDSGRLAGLQGGGPNVLGALLGIVTIVFLFYFINSFDNNLKVIYAIIFIISVFCLFLTFSRGSYLAIIASIFVYLYLDSRNLKVVIISGITFLTFGLFFLYFGNSQIILKDSDRALLLDIAVDEINIFQGVGGGQYLSDVYGPYLLALDRDLLLEKYNISINQIDSGIIPPGSEGKGDFLIASSGGGYEILQAALVADKCTGNRTTCQNARVNIESLAKFFSIVKDIKYEKISELISDSQCLNGEGLDYLVSRGEYACINSYINTEYLGELQPSPMIFTDSSDKENLYFRSLIQDSLFIQCERQDIAKLNYDEINFGCPSRKLAIGELSAITENLVLRQESLSLEKFTIFCEGCNLREVSGWLKIEYDRYDRILPRSVFRFYTSNNGIDWSQLGYDHTPGYIVDFTSNSGLIEIGGWVDGQSFGNTWLAGEVHEITINTKGTSRNIKFLEKNLNKDFNIYKPGTKEDYTSKISFTENGVLMYNPAKYWLSIENQDYNFNDDFEIALYIKVPEIIWNESVLVSLTSNFDSRVPSWKWIADDGRLFFTWTNEEGVFSNTIGDRSLRSGLLYTDSSSFQSGKPPTVDSAHLSQLTTAHNGFLTFAVEYGVLLSLIILSFFLYAIKIGINKGDKESNLLVVVLALLLFQNLTNDLIYAPDTALYIWLVVGLLTSLKD